MKKSKIYYCNTSFELRQNSKKALNIKQELTYNKICAQLQFLPLLFASSENFYVALGSLPQDHFSTLCSAYPFFKEPFPKQIETKETKLWPPYPVMCWGASPVLEMDGGINQTLKTPWDLSKKLSSKAFSFEKRPFLKNSALLKNLPDLDAWLHNHLSTPAVFKKEYGLSGIGLFWWDDQKSKKSLTEFCNKAWSQGQVIIAEPALCRVLDFSTQWKIESSTSLSFLGTCEINTSKKGHFLGTRIGKNLSITQKFPNLWQQHCLESKKILQSMAKLGYQGFVGVDSFLYSTPESNSLSLCPIVEINTRMTMSLIALLFAKKYLPDENVQVCYNSVEKGKVGLLPQVLSFEGSKHFTFDKQLYFNLFP